jgi:hypothetical protein
MAETAPVHRILVAIEAVDEKNFGREVAVSRITKVLDQLPPGMTWRFRKGEDQ